MSKESKSIIIKCLAHELEQWTSVANHHRNRLKELKAQYKDGSIPEEQFYRLAMSIQNDINEANTGYAKAMNAMLDVQELKV